MPDTWIAYYHSPSGDLEVTSSDEFITSVLYVDSVEAEREQKPPVLSECLRQLDEYFAGKRRIFQLPLAQSGTDFQKKIWSELEKIPYGKTVSYLELSKRIGNAKSIRAVGAANGKNKIGIIVPCHRVIGSDGSLVGYAGGLKNKLWLLDHEAKYSSGVQKMF